MDESPHVKATAEVESLTDEIAIVTVRGEHDLGTKSDLDAALAEAGLRRHVLVDLSHCAFMDSSALAVLLLAHRGQIKRAGRFELVVAGEAHPVRRILKLARIDAHLTFHETRSDGLASLVAEGDATWTAGRIDRCASRRADANPRGVTAAAWGNAVVCQLQWISRARTSVVQA